MTATKAYQKRLINNNQRKFFCGDYHSDSGHTAIRGSFDTLPVRVAVYQV